MKKYLFVFVTLFALTLLNGCGTQKNTVRFDGDESATSSSGEEANTDDDTLNDEETDKTDSADTSTGMAEPSSLPKGKLEVTSFDGAYLKTTYSYNVVKGNTPTGTRSIKINDYKLSKYIAGQTKWDYIAATRFGTLKNGLNTYTVKALDKDGKTIDSLIFSINYDAPKTAEILPGVGSSHWAILFAALVTSTIFALFRRYRWL